MASLASLAVRFTIFVNNQNISILKNKTTKHQAAIARVEELDASLNNIRSLNKQNNSQISFSINENEIVVSDLNLKLPFSEKLMLPKGNFLRRKQILNIQI
jgi:ABC-type uncharacterized transport system fused permease/ATPase subunit